ncbi:hypothetical protein, partial [Methanohalobium sp.]|uniref:hypothetical protein n=1 Tax=Methanohalobium sp. TaxID=2837493 RepID=UPI0025FF57F7
MNFTSFDFAILISMTTAVILMSFIFPALGLGDKDVQPSEIPSLNVTNDRFDFAGELPRSPGTPTQGELIWESSSTGGGTRDNVFLDGDTTNGNQVTWVNLNNESDPEMNVTFTTFNSGSIQTSTTERITENNATTISQDGYKIQFTHTRLKRNSDGSFISYLNYKMEETKSDDSWFKRIPYVGGVFDTVDQVASVLSWGFSIIYWGFAWI